MREQVQEHIRVAGLASANVSLASADSFFTHLEPILRSGLLIVQIAAAIVTVIYVVKKIRKPRK